MTAESSHFSCSLGVLFSCFSFIFSSWKSAAIAPTGCFLKDKPVRVLKDFNYPTCFQYLSSFNEFVSWLFDILYVLTILFHNWSFFLSGCVCGELEAHNLWFSSRGCVCWHSDGFFCLCVCCGFFSRLLFPLKSFLQWRKLSAYFVVPVTTSANVVIVFTPPNWTGFNINKSYFRWLPEAHINPIMKKAENTDTYQEKTANKSPLE